MVTTVRNDRKRGALATECVIALGILAVVMLPLSVSFQQEARVFRAYYHRAIALEIVDGEMELLVAGEWRSFQSGRQKYSVRAAAATNLPPGEFFLTLEGGSARLEWRGHHGGGTVVREAKLK